MTAPEKKLLEAILERGLGVQRRKPAAKKKSQAITAKRSAPKKPLATKRTPPKRDKGPF
jgi:hypothetical protein